MKARIKATGERVDVISKINEEALTVNDITYVELFLSPRREFKASELDFLDTNKEKVMKEKENVFVYVRGNKEYGKEVIEYLEKLGGVNRYSQIGYIEHYYYFINPTGFIGYIDTKNPTIDVNWFSKHYTEVKLDFKYQPADKELVWCWYNDDIAMRRLGFYDNRNKCAFFNDGSRNGASYNNYAKYDGDYPEWAKEAQRKLED